MAVDGSVNDLLALVKATLSADEIALISTPDTRNNEPDAYTALQNHFTQKNTDAMIKCAHTATPRISQSQWPHSVEVLWCHSYRSRVVMHANR